MQKPYFSFSRLFLMAWAVKNLISAKDEAFFRTMFNLYRKDSLRNVWDVGANSGDWSLSLSYLLRKANFQLFEANPAHRENLLKTGLPFHIALLSNANKNVNFYSVNGTGDSYYPEQSDFYSAVSPINLRAVTLDNLASELNLVSPDLIKLDVQGAELDVIHGFQNGIKKVRWVLMEVSLRPLNLGAPGVEEVSRTMHDLGFRPINLLGKNFIGKELVQVDLLFENQFENRI